MFSSFFNPSVQFILEEIEELAALVTRDGVIRSLDASVECRK